MKILNALIKSAEIGLDDRDQLCLDLTVDYGFTLQTMTTVDPRPEQLKALLELSEAVRFILLPARPIRVWLDNAGLIDRIGHITKNKWYP